LLIESLSLLKRTIYENLVLHPRIHGTVFFEGKTNLMKEEEKLKIKSFRLLECLKNF